MIYGFNYLITFSLNTLINKFDTRPKIETFDKHIARRYDNLGGSKHYITVLSLFYDKVLSMEDIAAFDEEMQNALIKSAKMLDE